MILSFYLNRAVSLTNLCKLHTVSMQIAQMLAVLISKIARFDYPREWYMFYLYLSFFDIQAQINLAQVLD